MNKAWWGGTVLLAAGLVVGALGAQAADQVLDKVTLNDGRIIQGQVVDENEAKVDVLVDGVNRSFTRDFVSKIDYGVAGKSDPAAPAASGFAPAPRLTGEALTADLSERYQVPPKDIVWVRQQGISEEDLPEVLETAADAQVSLGTVVKLRLEGRSWEEIRAHFGLDQGRGVRSSEPGPAVQVAVMAPLVLPPPLILRILLWPFLIFGRR